MSGTITQTPLDIYANGLMDEYCRIAEIDYFEFNMLLADDEPVEVPAYFMESAALWEGEGDI